MDWITQSISSINNSLLTQISVLLDNEIIFGAIIILFAILSCWQDKDQTKIKKIAIALILALLVGYGLKAILGVPRPCELIFPTTVINTSSFYNGVGVEIEPKIECPADSSFPSLHAILAFTLMISLLDRKRYFLYLIFALFVAFTRIYLGVHTFVDVAASLALSAIIYGTVDYYFKSKLNKNSKKVRK